jgi:nucleosome assembly protein 1-like 1
LPLSVQRRIKALKKLQLETTKLEGKFFEEVHNLEVKYLELYKPQYESRAKIVHGEK